MVLLRGIFAAGAVSVVAMCVFAAMIGAGLLVVLSGIVTIAKEFYNEH